MHNTCTTLIILENLDAFNTDDKFVRNIAPNDRECDWQQPTMLDQLLDDQINLRKQKGRIGIGWRHSVCVGAERSEKAVNNDRVCGMRDAIWGVQGMGVVAWCGKEA